MNLYPIDWLIVAIILGSLLLIGMYTKRYTRSVADFLAANRCAGRYMLTMADGITSLGAITVIAGFEMYYSAGFCPAFWSILFSPVGLIITLSGWVIYRYRQTRAMTLGQFFEMRYSRKFRIFAGILAWTSGVINYGVFPGITARFLIYFCGIPQKTIHLGWLDINVTLGIIMFIMLFLAWLLMFMGGQITVIITDFFQSQFTNIAFIGIAVILFVKFNVFDIMGKMADAPVGKSIINPFDQEGISGFTLSYFVMQAFMNFYLVMAWQGGQGFNCAAKTPHEARMARVLGYLRGSITGGILTLLPICVYAMLHYDDILPETAAATKSAIAAIQGSGWLQQQMTVPIAITKLFPVGMIGVFCAVIITATLATDNSYLLSWGSIFIQDIVLPLRKEKPITPERHMKILRLSSLGVAVFVWLFSMVFTLNDFIYMYFVITGAIYLGGAGSVIIGGLYWERSTTAGAWAGMITGSVLAICGLFLQNIFWPYFLPGLIKAYPQIGWFLKLPAEFPLNGMQMGFFTSFIAVMVFVIVSLFTKPKPDFSMDKLLHRGQYAIAAEDTSIKAKLGAGLKLFGITDEFSRRDKWVYFGSMFYVMSFLAFAVALLLIKLFFNISNKTWGKLWLFYTGYILVVGVIATIWFLFGGFRDMKDMFRTLKIVQRDTADDGSVHSSENEKKEPMLSTERL